MRDRPAALLSALRERKSSSERLVKLYKAIERMERMSHDEPQPTSAAPHLQYIRWHQWASLGSAALVLLIVGLVLWTPLSTAGRGAPYATGVGGFQSAKLADGSTVELNTDTEMRFQVSDARRDVRLLRGEAHFTVAHDAGHPFFVRAGNLSIRAVGTAFSVRMRDVDHVSVLVTDGRIIVRDESVTRRLLRSIRLGNRGRSLPASASAGELVTMDAGAIRLASVDPEDMARREMWREGKLMLSGKTLSEVVTEVNRYNFTKLVIADPAIRSLRLGGAVRPSDLDTILENLSSLRIRATRASSAAQGEQMILLSRQDVGAGNSQSRSHTLPSERRTLDPRE